MWSVKSEAGRLRAVAIQNNHWYSLRTRCPGLEPFDSCTLYERSAPQKDKLVEVLREEGVKVFVWGDVLKDIVDNASLKEREEIIDYVWSGIENKPDPEELKGEHLDNGYPLNPYYDEKAEKVVWGPEFPGGLASRDSSFGTPIGMVISSMRAFIRQIAPRVCKVMYTYYPEFQKNIEIAWDAHEHFSGFKKYTEYVGWRGSNGAIEGGDNHVIDEETIACGVGLRSNIFGFKAYLENIFRADREEKIKTLCAVKLIDHYASRVTHLDTVLNFVDRRKAIILPYVLESELARPKLPEKKLWVKLIESYSDYLGRWYQPINPSFTLNTKDLMHSGETEVYGRGKDGRPILLRREKNFIDYLIKEDKLDSDGLIPVGGWPEKENDILNVIITMQQHGRTGLNGVAVKPGLFVTFESNIQAVKALEDAGVRLRKLEDEYIVGFAGPHCLTCPLDRDAI